MPDDFAVVGMARSAFSSEQFREQQRQDIGRFNTRRTFDDATWRWLERRLHYTAGEFGDPLAYERLARLVAEVGRGTAAADNTLFYLAISPDFFGTVNDLLDRTGFTHLPGRRRIIVEKPFGKDLSSAVELNRALLSRWREEEIYRIDHYLGKETVQNLLAFRLANGMFSRLWNSRHIDHIQISATETVGVETRGEYYDKTGVVRDMLHPAVSGCGNPHAGEAAGPELRLAAHGDEVRLRRHLRGLPGHGLRGAALQRAQRRSDALLAHRLRGTVVENLPAGAGSLG